jgi:dihydroorotase
MSWEDVVVKLSSAPAKILGIEGGTLRVGMPGDIAIYNPVRTWTVDPSRMKSRSGNTAYFGWELPGQIAATVVGGVLHVND